MKPLSLPCLALLLLAGCGRNVVPVQELTRQSEKYDRTIVSVSGCYLTREGHAVLEPCGPERSVENMVWIDLAADVHASEVLSGVRQRQTEPVTARASQRALYDKLRQKPEGVATPVVVQGEYQASTVGLTGVAYRRRLILDRVLSVQE